MSDAVRFRLRFSTYHCKRFVLVSIRIRKLLVATQQQQRQQKKRNSPSLRKTSPLFTRWIDLMCFFSFPVFFRVCFVLLTIKKQKTSGFLTRDCMKPKSDFQRYRKIHTHPYKTMRQRINIYNIENETAIITIYEMFPILPKPVPLELLPVLVLVLLPVLLFLFLCILNFDGLIYWVLTGTPSLLTLSLCHFVVSVCVHVHSVIIFRCQFKIVCVRYVLFYFLDVTLFKCK